MNNSPADDRQDFVAGDLRVNEQPFLTSLHVLFMREHNRLGDRGRLLLFWSLLN